MRLALPTPRKVAQPVQRRIAHDRRVVQHPHLAPVHKHGADVPQQVALLVGAGDQHATAVHRLLDTLGQRVTRCADLRRLVGAALGAVLVNFLKTLFTTGMLAPSWLFLLGALFIGVTLALPKGIVGAIHEWSDKRRARAQAAAPAPQPAE